MTSLYATIEEARKKIEWWQNECPHMETIVGYTSWRPGRLQQAKICDECGKVVEVIVPDVVASAVTVTNNIEGLVDGSVG